MENIIITFTNGEKREYPKGVKLHEIINDIKKNYKFEIISAKFKNELAEVTISWDIYDFDLCCSVLKI